MKKSLIIAAALLSIVFITSNAFSWGQGQDGDRCGGGQAYGAKDRPAMPDLTDDQKTQLAQLRQQFIDDTYELRSGIMNQRWNIKMILETSSPDRGKLTAMSDAILDLEKKLAVKRIDYILAAKKIEPQLHIRDLGGFGRGPAPKGGKHCRNKPKPCPRVENNQG